MKVRYRKHPKANRASLLTITNYYGMLDINYNYLAVNIGSTKWPDRYIPFKFNLN